MKGIDHKIIGMCLAENYLSDAKEWEKKLFLAGCIMPDRNPLTYMRGSLKYQKFHGHNYLNASGVIKHYFHKLSNRRNWARRHYYCLGKLVHYAVDAFTFPHNEQFGGNIREHMDYEMQLHEKLIEQEMMRRFQAEEIGIHMENQLYEFFVQQHEEYITSRQELSDDLDYIRSVASNIMMNLTRGIQRAENYSIFDILFRKNLLGA